MIAIIYTVELGKVIHVVPDVISVTETDIVGKDASLKGIDTALATFIILDETTLEIGDTINPAEHVDKRTDLPKTDAEKLAKAIADNAALKIENEQVKSIATATSTDFMALTDYLAELGVI